MTNIDDIVLLALYFGQVTGQPGAASRIVLGQYLGFASILAVAVVGALGAGLTPEDFLRHLGLLPLALGLRAALQVWQERRSLDDEDNASSPLAGPGALSVAAITFANGGDDIGVYIPVFSKISTVGLITYVAVFLALVAVWCLAGRLLASRPFMARALTRCGHLLLPAVLIGIGLVILLQG